MQGHKLIVGARGWEHPGWRDGFYPEDLPEEWRLAYYANEFSGVLVPEQAWRDLDAAGCEAWCDEVAEGFLFYLEAPSPPSAGAAARRLPLWFGAHWGGWSDGAVAVLDAAEPWDLKTVRERMQRLVATAPEGAVPALFLPGEPPAIERLRQARMLADMI